MGACMSTNPKEEKKTEIEKPTKKPTEEPSTLNDAATENREGDLPEEHAEP